jgi:hypothetical protein
MIEHQVAELGTLIDTMERGGQALDTAALANVAKTLAKVFGVDADEVAILSLSLKEKSLKFVIPEKLAGVGSIPLTSSSALASRTARDKRADVLNNFSATRHATVA